MPVGCAVENARIPLTVAGIAHKRASARAEDAIPMEFARSDEGSLTGWGLVVLFSFSLWLWVALCVVWLCLSIKLLSAYYATTEVKNSLPTPMLCLLKQR